MPVQFLVHAECLGLCTVFWHFEHKSYDSLLSVRDVVVPNYISSTLHLIFSAERRTDGRTLIGWRSIEFTSSLRARLPIGCDAGAMTS